MTSRNDIDLRYERVKAAEFSKGISSNRIYAMIERVILDMNLRGRVLDYGAGVGSLTQRLLELGRFNAITAADIMAAPAGLPGAVEWIEQDLNAPLPDRENAFDAVIAAEVIEHLENPRFMIREIFRILRPGGVALITTPNNESWRSMLALLIRGNYAAFGELNYPAHITPILRKDFTRAFGEAGFPSPEFYFTDDGGIPGRPELAWQQVSFGRLRGVRFSDNFMAVAAKPV
jgi:2-polyprenyl-3-methyl-5-hydroxy-6-metoxy-1,4-benzoquinol methylase